MTVPTRLDIQLADSAVSIAYTSEPDPYVLPFGKAVKKALPDDVELEAKAAWDAGWVVVTRSVSGGSVNEPMTASADGKRLTVDVEIGRGGGDPIKFRRVYDRITESP